MRNPIYRFLIAGSVALAVVSCGPDDGYRLARVRGTVTYKGEPVQSGSLVFLPDEGPQAMSRITEDGSFILSTKVSDDGAVIGKHRVGIMVLDPEPIEEVEEEERTPEAIMTTKGQAAQRQQTQAKKALGPTFTDRGGNVYRVLTPEDLRSPETSGVTVEVQRGSNRIHFRIQEDGTVDVES